MPYARELLGANFSVPEAAGLCGFETDVNAAGSVQGDAASITTSMSMVAGADGTKGVILPAAVAGDEMWIFNNSASALKVYPDSGAAISIAGSGLGAANTALSVAAYKSAIFRRFTSVQWVAVITS